MSDAPENIRETREIICRAGRAPRQVVDQLVVANLMRILTFALSARLPNDLQSPNIVAASIEVEHRALVRSARAVGLRSNSIRPARARQGKPTGVRYCQKRAHVAKVQGRSTFCNTASQN
jgi:hypothetical protein